MSERLKHTMVGAAGQMRALRRENELLRAKVETFHLCADMVFARPREHGGIIQEEDFAWRLELEAEALTETKPSADVEAPSFREKSDLKKMIEFTEKKLAQLKASSEALRQTKE